MHFVEQSMISVSSCMSIFGKNSEVTQNDMIEHCSQPII